MAHVFKAGDWVIYAGGDPRYYDPKYINGIGIVVGPGAATLTTRVRWIACLCKHNTESSDVFSTNIELLSPTDYEEGEKHGR